MTHDAAADDVRPTHLSRSRPVDGVALITLDNPDQRNAMTDEMTASWGAAIDELAADESVRAVVVTGAGSAFCSGGVTSWLVPEEGQSVDDLRTRMLGFYRAWLRIRDLGVPTIAAINGPAIGAGLCIALACDLRFAADDARMGVPFVKLGLHPGMAATYLLPEVVGEAAARDLLLTGRLVKAEEAQRIGLVSRTFAADGFLEQVLAVAGSIAQTAPVASRYTTQALRQRHPDIESALRWEAFAQPITMATQDLREGIAAVAQKRAPRFEGH